MLVVAEVLAGNGKFEAGDGFPGEPDVKGDVSRHVRSGQSIDVAQGPIQRKMVWQIEHGLKDNLMFRVVALAGAIVDVMMSGLVPNIFVEISVTSAQPPAAGYLPGSR